MYANRFILRSKRLLSIVPVIKSSVTSDIVLKAEAGDSIFLVLRMFFSYTFFLLPTPAATFVEHIIIFYEL